MERKIGINMGQAKKLRNHAIIHEKGREKQNAKYNT